VSNRPGNGYKEIGNSCDRIVMQIAIEPVEGPSCVGGAAWGLSARQRSAEEDIQAGPVREVAGVALHIMLYFALAHSIYLLGIR